MTTGIQISNLSGQITHRYRIYNTRKVLIIIKNLTRVDGLIKKKIQNRYVIVQKKKYLKKIPKNAHESMKERIIQNRSVFY